MILDFYNSNLYPDLLWNMFTQKKKVTFPSGSTKEKHIFKV